jgi:F-type H+-transporting ATPase subunit b
VDITLTLFGQSFAFFVFWWFCSTKVWPLFSNVLEERKQRIADGLEAAARAEKDLELAQARSTDQMKEAKVEAAGIIDLANKRSAQIIDEAKDKAGEEAQRKEALRMRVSAIAIAGAEKILERSIDQAANEDLLEKLAAEL